MSKPREQINDWLKTIDVTGKTVLDVGAGRPRAWLFPPEDEGSPKVSGKPLAYHTADIDEQWGCDYELDLNSDKSVRQALAEYKSDCGEAIFVVKTFDYVFCLETLEHIYDPIQTIKNLAEITEEKLFITVPFINPVHDVYDFLRYTSQWFEKVLPQFGFTQVHIKQRPATNGKEELHEFYRKEGMRMSKISRKLGFSKNYFDVGYSITAIK